MKTLSVWALGLSAMPWTEIPLRWRIAIIAAVALIGLEIVLQITFALVRRRRELCQHCYTRMAARAGGLKACQCGRKLENA